MALTTLNCELQLYEDITLGHYQFPVIKTGGSSWAKSNQVEFKKLILDKIFKSFCCISAIYDLVFTSRNFVYGFSI